MAISISVEYEGGLRCRATHGPSQNQSITDAPVDNNGKGESFSPTDLVATALATCMATVIGIKAQQKGYDIVGMKVGVEKHMSADSPRRIVALPITIEIPLPEDHPDRKLLEATALGCPVHHSVHPDIDKPVTFVWSGK
ncbi:MAG: OsmC family protein [Prosthecobacter sp.]|uniref:OsmC family protein n=1 Tax=Prosthecobacter sp. TaxID=1965333 RepID=UPI0025E45797|nr:OsmC family protein [Prosthecobacter sp.]MCF7787178.1 OsmC family protein [Prosthecobacter sp.]